MKKIEVTDEQVKAYKNLVKLGATNEELKGLVNENILEEIKRKADEQEVLNPLNMEQKQEKTYEQDKGLDMQM